MVGGASGYTPAGFSMCAHAAFDHTVQPLVHVALLLGRFGCTIARCRIFECCITYPVDVLARSITFDFYAV